ncbi:TDT family transporter [Aquabacter sp. L1I39]|uniref:TDT family transporter n=1 Tax=Aquabacter sp. L1I39 TaxID=2820278 RepID=UPI001ADCA1A7|nr:TDT family transporter [Aquabacter sp. L1I39]QTL04538.1 TDT family transporter [Aquabacter sp. L1I39]
MATTHAPQAGSGRHVPFGGLREAVRQFTPNWFAATMGTGVLALALNQFPIAFPGQHPLAVTLWLFNIGLFCLFTVLYASRWIFFGHEAKRIFQHPVVSMFFGTIPMGLATIVNGFVTFGMPMWGEVALNIAHVLWWLDVALALACGLLIPFLMFTQQDHALEKMTAVWLLPIVAAEVAAASGGGLVPVLPAGEAYGVLFISYALWAFSVPLAMSILVILLLRLTLHKLPTRDMAASGWLALGPIGTGALGLLTLGGNASPVLAHAGLESVGPVAFGIGIIGATILWGYGAWWLMLAMLKTARYLKEGMPFNIGWWGFTFPLGVYSLATMGLGRVTHFDFFTIVGSGLILLLTGLWLVVATRTAQGAWRGTLFFSPCLVSGVAPAQSLPQVVPQPKAA